MQDESTLILEQQILPRYSPLAPTLEYPEVRRGKPRGRCRSVARTWGRTLFRTLMVVLVLIAIFGSPGSHHFHFASEKLGIDALIEVEVSFDR